MVRMRGVYDDWDCFKTALSSLKQTRGRGYTAYGPVNLKEVEELMPARSSYVRGWATVGAAGGLVTFFVMCVATSLIYSLVVGGKPPVSNVPYVVPMYEGTILVGSIFGFGAGLVYAYVGPRPLPEGYDPRFSEDSFGVEVTCDPSERQRITDLLTSAGAVEVYEL